MKKKSCKSSKNSIENILSILEEMKDKMKGLEDSADLLLIKKDDVGGPCIEFDSEGELIISIYFYDLGYFYTVDEIVNRSFEVVDDNDDLKKAVLCMKKFRDAFDQAVERNIKEYCRLE